MGWCLRGLNFGCLFSSTVANAIATLTLISPNPVSPKNTATHGWTLVSKEVSADERCYTQTRLQPGNVHM